MKYNILTLLLLLFGFAVTGQQITLKMVIDSAITNYPLSRQQYILSDKTDKELIMIRNTNLPQVNMTGRATYQNEVITLPLKIPGMDIPQLNKDQYKIQLDITQAIYKGGLTKAQKALAQTNNLIENKEYEIELNKIKFDVVKIYYGILLNDELKKVSITYLNTLNSKLKEMQAAIDNGMLLKSDAAVVKAEKLSIEQRITSFNIKRAYFLKQLGNYTGIKFNGNETFSLPDTKIAADVVQQRAEYELMSLNRKKLEVMKDFSSAKSMPKAFAFSNVGYGRPGFNYLSNDFSFYALVGVGISWNIWSWDKYNNEKTILDFNSKLIENSQKSFVVSLNDKLLELKAEIEIQMEMLKKAKEIESLRKTVVKTTDRRLKNGTITTSRYIDELQKYEKARLDVEIYKIKLSLAKTNYLWALGIL